MRHLSFTKLTISLFSLALLSGCAEKQPAVEPAGLISGIDKVGMDRSVRPQDDFYNYANGGWLASTEIPADEVGWGSYMTLRKKSLEQSRIIVEEAARYSGDDLAKRKIGDYYNAFLNEQKIENLGLAPISDYLTTISKLKDHDQVAEFLGKINPAGIDGPFNLYVGQDDKEATSYILHFVESGLGLPDRDYYSDQSERGKEIIVRYQQYLEQLLTLSGHEQPVLGAGRILALETRLAAHQWDKVDNRDADKRYNKRSAAEFREMLSAFNLEGYMVGIGVTLPDYLLVGQPSYLSAFNQLFKDVELAAWKDYLRAKVVSSYANYLPKVFVDSHFDFYSKFLYGREQQQPRWRKAVSSINGNIGELLGQLYVAKHFAAESKARMTTMVDNLIAAYAESIKDLDWMSEETKQQSLIKLSKFTPKIGYPDTWKDYSALTIKGDDLAGNIKRARTFAHHQNMAKLGSPIDRNEWFMAPQEVNAYYNPGLNEIVFPAAYLQPPNFIPSAEDAYNYGTIGSTIGHEIGHGFDDQGSKYDGDGNLVSWWTDIDREQFEARTKGLVEQFSKFEALPGLFVNGELTLGENIGDLGGTSIALKAYRMSLKGEPSPVIDGFSGEQRFFLGNAQSSRIKWRDQILEIIVRTDPHSPDVYRINGVFPNMPDFYDTYNVQPGDALFLPEKQRVKIW
ncbi:peptidase M13 [SAR92 clade bacterium H455]|uniref:Peptidase M13 n=1 Tax=SAR92 clade bacterium H455 TaxID=2974818 RepID=A0ABY5TM80_9GAMM|nr:peptidase M13 [SAR92 clade bacterium H455]